MASTYENLRSKADETADRIAAATPPEVADAANRLKQEADVQIDRLSDSIRQKPLQSAAIAAGLGFLFAVIARR
jgi:ElaB/YqjD/DUF883 family membrane-anchored ribosome-binding protein